MSIDYMKYAPEWVQEFKRCEQWIQAALDYSHDTFSIEDIFEDMAAGNLQIWPGEKAVIVTQIVQYPRKKIIHCFLAGGDIVELETLHEQVVEWGRSQGCSAVTLTGRPGWTRSFLSDIGYRNTQVQMIKDI